MTIEGSAYQEERIDLEVDLYSGIITIGAY